MATSNAGTDVVRLMQRVFELSAEMTALLAEGTEQAEQRLDKGVWPEIEHAFQALIAARSSWPAEWREAIAAWCEAWTVWRRHSPSMTPDEDDAPDVAAEELGLLLAIAGAPELRALRAKHRAQLREIHREGERESREVAESYVQMFHEMPLLRREMWLARGESGTRRRAVLIQSLMRTRIRCGIGGGEDRLAAPLLALANAVIELLDASDQGGPTDPLWDGVERSAAALARAVKREEEASVRH